MTRVISPILLAAISFMVGCAAHAAASKAAIPDPAKYKLDPP